jgi:hypothetical protein
MPGHRPSRIRANLRTRKRPENQKPRVSRRSHGAEKSIRAEFSSAGQPPGLSFSSTQRTFPFPFEDSHLRQSLNPTMPALPVGASPRFRAVACVCVVASPNEARICFSRSLAPPASQKVRINLDTNSPRLCQEKRRKAAPKRWISPHANAPPFLETALTSAGPWSI